MPDEGTLQKLNQAATQKLSEIVRRNKAQEPLWQGFDFRADIDVRSDT